ncbi:MAG: IS66 family transposase [Planctomycetota bacterium]|jgi:transposase
MAVELDALPNDVEKLKEIIQKEKSEKEFYKKEYEDLRRQIFARKSERLKLPVEEQDRLFNEAEEAFTKPEQSVAVKSHRRKKKLAKKRKPVIPEGLPEKVIQHELTDKERECSCCEEPMEKIGEDTARELHVIPEQLIVHKHIYPKYACSKCKEDSTIASPERNRFLAGSIAGSGLLSYVIQRKYQFGLPLYRIDAMFKAIEVDISRQSMSNWIISAAKKLAPIYKILKNDLKKGQCIYIDETPVQVLNEKDRPNTTKSFMWHMRASFDQKEVCYFEYRQGRSANFLQNWLRDYKGSILTDGWKSYDTLVTAIGVDHAGCWTHARRYFYKTAQEDKDNKDAAHLLHLIGKLFRLEAACERVKNDNEFRLKNRRRFSAPIIKQIEKYIYEIESKYPPKSRMGESIQYTKNQWSKLILFLKKPTVKIHNNDVENGIRPFVIGRKNWLFSGCPEGAHASSLFYSLVETAKANGLNPYDYLTYLFEKFPAAQKSGEFEQLTALLPYHVTTKELSGFFGEYGQI